MESLEKGYAPESREFARLRPEQAIRDEQRVLEKLSGKAKKLAAALMMVSTLSFGEGCNRDLEEIQAKGVQVGEVIKEHGISEQDQIFLKELFELVHPINGVGNVELAEEFISVHILAEHEEDLQKDVPEGERLSAARIQELLESFKATPKNHSVEESLKLRRSVRADLDKAKSIVASNPELALQQTQALGTGVYAFFDRELGNGDGVLDAEEQSRANIMRFTNSNISALRRMELHARETIAEKSAK